MAVTDRSPATKGDADILFIGAATDEAHRGLLYWLQNTPGLHDFWPDYHRLQLEYWLWTFKDRLIGKSVLDIGVQLPRRWLGEGYRTFGNTTDVEADIKGDLLNLAGIHGAERWDAIICTEVLEHCENPQWACQQMYEALKPGGLLLASAPFIWPDHRTDEYPDFWRFTEQGWHLLMRDFVDVKVTPTGWTSEAVPLLDLVRRFEGWGFRHLIKMYTGYLVEAHKGS